MSFNKRKQKRNARTSWEPVANWYDGWMGERGSKHHRQLAIPLLLEMLQVQRRDHLLDIGAGQGVLAPHIAAMGVRYTGVDLSRKLLQKARRYHGRLPNVTFLQGDARRLARVSGLQHGRFETAVFLLSIQDMDPLQHVLASASWALGRNGRLLIVMTHPCFRVPRQSGWGWDRQRKLRYRRVDRYLTALPVPMKTHQQGVTRSFHRPLQAYVNGLAEAGLMIDQICEVPAGDVIKKQVKQKAEQIANAEIPLFLGIRAIKVRDEG